MASSRKTAKSLIVRIPISDPCPPYHANQRTANKKGEPFKFKLGAGEVIKGWDVGVAGLQVGGERRITIPAKLGYGSKAIPGIPANSSLTFDIKRLS